MQNKGLLHYNFWLGNSFFSNKIWKSIEKNLHHSIKGRYQKENVGAPLSFSLEAKFQQEEIALEQLNGSVRASPRRQQGGASLLAGVLVFVHVGLHQVRHLTGVHLTTLAVTHLRRQHSESQTHSQLCQILCQAGGNAYWEEGEKENMGYFWISNCSQIAFPTVWTLVLEAIRV